MPRVSVAASHHNKLLPTDCSTRKTAPQLIAPPVICTVWHRPLPALPPSTFSAVCDK